MLHGFGPDPSCHTSDHTVFRIHSIAEKERKIWCKIIYVHSTAQIIFYISKAIGKSKCNWVMDWRLLQQYDNPEIYAVKIAHLFSIKYSCTSPINFSANSVEKMQVFCAWSSFKISACTVPRTWDKASFFNCS
jgi:hypothetical protein